MGTNFYLNIKNKDFAEKYFHGEYTIYELAFFRYEVHIGKTSMGWKSLYQSHKAAYNSVEEMMSFIKEHYPKEIKIYDEYDNELNPDELKKRLIDWDDLFAKQYVKYVPEKKNKKYSHYYFVKGTKDDYDITIPYDYVEYSKFSTYNQVLKYYHDKDGYNFTDKDFC